MNASFTDLDVAALLRIAAEVSQLGHDVHARRAHILDGLLAQMGGCLAVCSEIDPHSADGSGWAVPDSITCAGGLPSDRRDMIDRYLTGRLAALDPCVPPLLRAEKAVVTVRRAEVVDDSRWYRSDHFNALRRPLGLGESMYAKLTTPDGRRLKMSFHREPNDPPFTERDARLLQVFNENLAGLYATPARADGQIGSLPLRLRPVLRRLLAGDAEKQVALALGLSQHTVHQYTKALYRAFRVNSRGELLARFVVRD
jgi:DNA-binding CsgD family transcriptional regulator